MIEVTHNFDASKFMWLWTKYVTGFNPQQHCTNAIHGRYSKKLWRGNPHLVDDRTVVLDECPPGSYSAIYICGVSRAGYSSGKNYPHNVHAAIVPVEGHTDTWAFEEWRMAIRGGRFSQIPSSSEELPAEYRELPTEFTSCRIFRWAAVHHGATDE